MGTFIKEEPKLRNEDIEVYMKGDTMKKCVLIVVAVFCTAIAACSSDQGKQQLETAQFEEKQHNREHAIKLYEEVVTKYPGSPNAKIAQDRLKALDGDK